MTSESLLRLDSLSVVDRRHGQDRTLVRSVSLDIAAAESVGLVGESGSGKSLTIKAAMQLLPRGLRAGGTVTFEDTDVLSMRGRELARYRSREVGLIHQDPRAHINPTRTIGQFLTEGVVHTGLMREDDALARCCELMRDVGITDAERRLAQYPHQLSGGLLQRVMIVSVLLPEPRMIFADEPTTALDVTVQSDVMAIMMEQIQDRRVAMLFVTHDLDLAAAVTDRLAVMYAGSIVESGGSGDVDAHPLHPYTAGLLQCRPTTTKVHRLTAIPGRPVPAYEVKQGCAFAPRCAFATERCQTEAPDLREVGGRLVACHRAEELADRLQERAS